MLPDFSPGSIGPGRTRRIVIGAWGRFPSLVGQTVEGKRLDLPTSAGGKVAVVIFSFSRSGGRDAQNWAQHL